MQKTTVTACLTLGAILIAGAAIAGPPYCPNEQGNLAPFCSDSCNDSRPCSKNCRADDAEASCITCGDWGACVPDPPPPPPIPETADNFHGIAVITRTNGCQETVAVHSQTISGNNFHLFVDKGPCQVAGPSLTLPIGTRVTPDGRWKISFATPTPWGDILITPSDPGVRAQFAAAFPARSMVNHDVFFVTNDLNIEILFLSPGSGQ